MRRENASVTGQVTEAYGAIIELVPMNSAMNRTTAKTIKELYVEYQQVPNLKLTPLNEEYFRKLVHELKIKIDCDPQHCMYHSCWNSAKDKRTLGILVCSDLC